MATGLTAFPGVSVTSSAAAAAFGYSEITAFHGRRQMAQSLSDPEQGVFTTPEMGS